MVEPFLLDTGVLVALANKSDRDHQRCVAFMRAFRGRLLTVEGVLVEAAFLLHGQREGPSKMLELVAAMNVERHAVSTRGLVRVGQLLKQYKRMDLVDGLLVAAGDEREIGRILTLDRRDFGIYRLQSGAGFEMFP